MASVIDEEDTSDAANYIRGEAESREASWVEQGIAREEKRDDSDDPDCWTSKSYQEKEERRIREKIEREKRWRQEEESAKRREESDKRSRLNGELQNRKREALAQERLQVGDIVTIRSPTSARSRTIKAQIVVIDHDAKKAKVSYPVAGGIAYDTVPFGEIRSIDTTPDDRKAWSSKEETFKQMHDPASNRPYWVSDKTGQATWVNPYRPSSPQIVVAGLVVAAIMFVAYALILADRKSEELEESNKRETDNVIQQFGELISDMMGWNK